MKRRTLIRDDSRRIKIFFRPVMYADILMVSVVDSDSSQSLNNDI